MRRSLSHVGMIAMLILLYDCKKDDPKPCTMVVDPSVLAVVNQTQLAKDVAAIDAYLSNSAITTAIKDGNVRYVITDPGSSTSPCLESNVSVTYSGKLMSTGAVFDKATAAVSFPLNGLIVGWQICLPKLGKGGKITMFLPSGYGYGPTGSPGKIPANANLIFEVQLVDFSN